MLHSCSMFCCLIQRFKILVICFVQTAKLYHMIPKCVYITEKILERISPFHAVQISDKSSGAFSVWPNIYPREVTSLWGYMFHRPNFTPVLAKLYTKLWGNDEPLNFFIIFLINYCELKPQRWFSGSTQPLSADILISSLGAMAEV